MVLCHFLTNGFLACPSVSHHFNLRSDRRSKRMLRSSNKKTWILYVTEDAMVAVASLPQFAKADSTDSTSLVDLQWTYVPSA